MNAVNLSGGQPQLYWCLWWTGVSKCYEIARICQPTQGQHIQWTFNSLRGLYLDLVTHCEEGQGHIILWAKGAFAQGPAWAGGPQTQSTTEFRVFSIRCTTHILNILWFVRFLIFSVPYTRENVWELDLETVGSKPETWRKTQYVFPHSEIYAIVVFVLQSSRPMFEIH